MVIFFLLDVKFQRKYRPSTTSRLSDSSSDESESSDYTVQAFRQTSSSSSDGEESECSPARIIGQPNKKRVRTGYRSWSKNLSARSNQDNQREFEERAMKQVRIGDADNFSALTLSHSHCRSCRWWRKRRACQIQAINSISKAVRTSSSSWNGAKIT